MTPIFISGIGTGVGKTIVSAIVTEALEADYWKPVQAGFEDGTDSLQVQQLITNATSKIYPEVYKLSMPASPHIAARNESIRIDLNTIVDACEKLTGKNKYLVIEGAGGLMVPLNENEFVMDLVKKLGARLLLVSKNYLGSINHSLLTAALCRQHNIDVLGWVFNDHYLDYEADIVKWSGFPSIASIPPLIDLSTKEVQQQASRIKEALITVLHN